jgi:Asp-tRNA(Asn)/Glu-tRNA(Gln) amidotransferase A subunit family amidase
VTVRSWASARQLRADIGAGRRSAVEVVEDCLAHIQSSDVALHAWVHVAAAGALAEAAAVDAARVRGETLGPLAGVPFGIKDIFNTRDMPTEMGSPIWKGFTPGNDARVVFYARQAGAVAMGKTATAEFAVHQLGKTMHPLDAGRNPGTSSTGSAVAVASGQVPIALGTQTAGSIVRPASYCGVYGYKPSFGLVPRTGMLKTTDSLDSVGFFARAVEDLRLVFDVLRVSGRDFPLSDAALNDKMRQSKPGGRSWRVLVARPHTWDQTQGYARALFDRQLARWNEQGITLVEHQLPSETTSAHEIHAIIYEKTLAYYFTEEAKKAQLISPVLNAMIARGSQVSLDQYKQALARQNALMARMDAFFGELDVDALVTLSVAGEAPLRDEAEPADSCLLWTLCGLPAANVPAMMGPRGLPIGIQVVARRYNDYRLLGLLEHLADRGLAPLASSNQNFAAH